MNRIGFITGRAVTEIPMEAANRCQRHGAEREGQVIDLFVVDS